MPKRFTDTMKWDDPWFGDLSKDNKLAWGFLCDKCDHAGIWKVNERLAVFHLGQMPDIKALGGRVIQLSPGKWFLPKFVNFQYGNLNPSNRVHASIIAILKKEGASKALKRPLRGSNDKDKDKDKDVVENGFDRFWELYPRKKGKEGARKACAKIESDKYEPILNALKAQLPTMAEGDIKFIKHPATWLNQECWLDVNDDDAKINKNTQSIMALKKCLSCYTKQPEVLSMFCSDCSWCVVCDDQDRESKKDPKDLKVNTGGGAICGECLKSREEGK